MTGWAVRAAVADDLAAISRMPPLNDPIAVVLPANEREWLLVATRHGIPVGCIRVRRAIGLDTARYWFHVGCIVHAAPELRLFHQQSTLLLNNDHTGAAELTDLTCDTALNPSEHRDTLHLLVRAALLLIGRERARTGVTAFDGRLIVELPGVRDADGRSPFWQGFGRHFYGGDPLLAARRFGAAWRTHVAALLPRDLLVASFISMQAQAMIGEILPAARMHARVLAAEGLRYDDYIAIDDAGPVFESHIDTLPGVSVTRRAIRDPHDDEALQPVLLTRVEGCDVHTVEAAISAGSIGIPAEQRQRLGLEGGAAVWTRSLSQ